MSSLSAVIEAYEKLCAYCDGFFSGFVRKYPERLQCRSGCHACCELSSVNALEAFVIFRYLRGHPVSGSGGSINGSCALLKRKQCTIYPVRPTICRTHGVPMRAASEQGGSVSICPLNESVLPIVAATPELVLDAERVADHLVRFNLAFCVLIQSPELASERFLLSDLRKGALPAAIREAVCASGSAGSVLSFS